MGMRQICSDNTTLLQWRVECKNSLKGNNQTAWVYSFITWSEKIVNFLRDIWWENQPGGGEWRGIPAIMSMTYTFAQLDDIRCWKIFRWSSQKKDLCVIIMMDVNKLSALVLH